MKNIVTKSIFTVLIIPILLILSSCSSDLRLKDSPLEDSSLDFKYIKYYDNDYLYFTHDSIFTNSGFILKYELNTGEYSTIDITEYADEDAWVMQMGYMAPYVRIYSEDSIIYYNFAEDKVYEDNDELIPYEEYDVTKSMYAGNYGIYHNSKEENMGQFVVIDDNKNEIVGSYDMGNTIYSTDIPRIYDGSLYLSYIMENEGLYDGYSVVIDLETGVMTRNLVNTGFSDTSSYAKAYHLEAADGMIYAYENDSNGDFEIGYNYGATLDFILEDQFQFYASKSYNSAKYNSYISGEETDVYYNRYQSGEHKRVVKLDIEGYSYVDCINDEYILLNFRDEPKYHDGSNQVMHYALYDISEGKIIDKIYMY